MRYLLLLSCSVLFLFNCNNDDEPTFDQDVLLTVRNFESYPVPDAVFLSNDEGKTISHKDRNFQNELLMKNEIPFSENDFDLNFVYEQETSAGWNLKIETYPNIDFQEWTFKDRWTSNLNSDIGVFTYLADSSIIDFQVSYEMTCGGWRLSSLDELKTEGSISREFNLDCGNVFILFQKENEEQWYYVEYNGIANQDTIQLDFASYPQGILEDLDFGGAANAKILQIRGLNEAGTFNNSKSFYQHNLVISGYHLPDGKVWYPQNIFESFFVRAEMNQDSFYYYIEQTGDPLYNRTFENPNLELLGTGVDSFKLTSNNTDADFFSTVWEVQTNEAIIEWTFYHDIDEGGFFKLPEIPKQVIADQDWLSRSDFKLKALRSHHYEKYFSYQEYLDSRYGAAEGGEGLILVEKGGDYELKELRKY